MMGLDNRSEKATFKSREELIEECLEVGIPVAGYEDKDALEMFLGSKDDDLDGFDEEPSDDDEMFDEDFDFEDDDDDDDFFEDDDVSYN